MSLSESVPAVSVVARASERAEEKSCQLLPAAERRGTRRRNVQQLVRLDLLLPARRVFANSASARGRAPMDNKRQVRSARVTPDAGSLSSESPESLRRLAHLGRVEYRRGPLVKVWKPVACFVGFVKLTPMSALSIVTLARPRACTDLCSSTACACP